MLATCAQPSIKGKTNKKSWPRSAIEAAICSRIAAQSTPLRVYTMSDGKERVKDSDTSASCGECEKDLGSADAVGCDGMCNLWFHKECSGMTKGEFDILKRDKCKLLWICKNCKPIMFKKEDARNNEINNLTKMIENIAKYVTNGNRDQEMRNEIERMEKQITIHDKKIAELTDKIDKADPEPTNTARQNESKGNTNGQEQEPPPPEKVADSASTSSTNMGNNQDTPIRNRSVIAHTEQQRSLISTSETQPKDPCQNKTNTAPTSSTHREINLRPAKENKKQENECIKGTGNPGNHPLKAAPKREWLFQGNLAADTTREEVKKFLELYEMHDVVCEEMRTRLNKAFKLGVTEDQAAQLRSPDIWPEGITIKPFRFKTYAKPRPRLRQRGPNESSPLEHRGP